MYLNRREDTFLVETAVVVSVTLVAADNGVA